MESRRYYTRWGWLHGRGGPVEPIAVLRHSDQGELQMWRAGKWVTIPWPHTPLNEDPMYGRTPETEALALAQIL